MKRFLIYTASTLLLGGNVLLADGEGKGRAARFQKQGKSAGCMAGDKGVLSQFARGGEQFRQMGRAGKHNFNPMQSSWQNPMLQRNHGYNRMQPQMNYNHYNRMQPVVNYNSNNRTLPMQQNQAMQHLQMLQQQHAYNRVMTMQHGGVHNRYYPMQNQRLNFNYNKFQQPFQRVNLR